MPEYNMQAIRSIVRAMLLGAQKEAVRNPPKRGRPFVDLVAGEVHRTWIGDWKPNRMPMACNAMRQLMGPDDEILEQPPKGNGPRLRIRYYLE